MKKLVSKSILFGSFIAIGMFLSSELSASSLILSSSLSSSTSGMRDIETFTESGRSEDIKPVQSSAFDSIIPADLLYDYLSSEKLEHLSQNLLSKLYPFPLSYLSFTFSSTSTEGQSREKRFTIYLAAQEKKEGFDFASFHRLAHEVQLTEETFFDELCLERSKYYCQIGDYVEAYLNLVNCDYLVRGHDANSSLVSVNANRYNKSIVLIANRLDQELHLYTYLFNHLQLFRLGIIKTDTFAAITKYVRSLPELISKIKKQRFKNLMTQVRGYEEIYNHPAKSARKDEIFQESLFFENSDYISAQYYFEKGLYELAYLSIVTCDYFQEVRDENGNFIGANLNFHDDLKDLRNYRLEQIFYLYAKIHEGLIKIKSDFPNTILCRNILNILGYSSRLTLAETLDGYFSYFRYADPQYLINLAEQKIKEYNSNIYQADMICLSELSSSQPDYKKKAEAEQKAYYYENVREKMGNFLMAVNSQAEDIEEKYQRHQIEMRNLKMIERIRANEKKRH